MRSSRFNIFKEKNKIKKPPKEYLGLVWKIILAIFFTFMFLLTLTGCVQSFALTNGTGLSNGPEVIQKKEHQNPRFVKVNLFDENKVDKKISLKPYIDSVEKKRFLDFKNTEDKYILKYYQKQIHEQTDGYFKDAYYGVNAVIKVGSEDDKDPLILSWRPVDKNYKFYEALLSKFKNKIDEKSINEKKNKWLKFKFDFNENNLSGHHEDWKLLIKGRDVLKENKKHILYTKYRFLEKVLEEYRNKFEIDKNDLKIIKTYDKNKLLEVNVFYNYDKLMMKDEKDIDNHGNSYGFAKLLKFIQSTLSFDDSKEYIRYLKLLNPYYEKTEKKEDINKYKTEYINTLKEDSEVETKNFQELLDGTIKSRISEDKKFKRLYWVKHYPIYDFNSAWKIGPFFSFIVYPLSKLYLLISNSFGQWSGWETILAITILVLIARIIQFIIGFKSKLQQAKTEALTYKKQAIEAKYAKYENNRQMKMRKQMEISKLHKKHGINMGTSMLMMLIQIPFFLALWRVINGIQQIKTETWLAIEFAETSWRRLFQGGFQYLPLLILAFGIQMLSVLIPKWLTKKQNKYKPVIIKPKEETTMMKVQKYMPFIFPIMSLMFSAGLQIYWIIGGIFSIIEAFIFHKINIKQKIKSKTVGFKQYDFL